MFSRMLKRMLFWTLLIALIWAGGLIWFTLQIPEEEGKAPPNADAIIVLTGGNDRLKKGLQLLWDGHAEQLLISGVQPGVTLNELYRTLGSTHIPATGQVELGYQAGSTMGNAVEVKEWIDRKPSIKSALLVTANYHMPRSVVELENTVPAVEFIPVAVFPQDFHRNAWWRHKDSRALVLSEYHKYVLASIRHLLIDWSR